MVISGDCLSGIVGTNTLQAPVVHGAEVEVGRRLLQLHGPLKCRIIVTEVCVRAGSVGAAAPPNSCLWQ